MTPQQTLDSLDSLGKALALANHPSALAKCLARGLVQLGASGASVTLTASGHLSEATQTAGQDLTDVPAGDMVTWELTGSDDQTRAHIAYATTTPLRQSAVGILRQLATQAADRVALRSELEARSRELQQAGRLAALGTLAASLTHEIRNPMVSIKTFLQLLPERRDDPEFMGDFLNLTETEVNRVTELLDQLLDIARPASPQYQIGNLNDVVRRTLALLTSEERERNVRVETALDPQLPAMRLDPAQLPSGCAQSLAERVPSIARGGVHHARNGHRRRRRYPLGARSWARHPRRYPAQGVCAVHLFQEAR